jgi:hypothetical protein
MARHSRRSLEGYLSVDHRNSPGLPKDFFQKIGLNVETPKDLTEGRLCEAATITCCHCGTVMIKNLLRTRERGHCSKCDEYVCDNPVCRIECKPFRKTLDDAEKLAHRGLIFTPPASEGNQNG